MLVSYSNTKAQCENITSPLYQKKGAPLVHVKVT